MKYDGRQQNVEEDFWVKRHLLQYGVALVGADIVLVDLSLVLILINLVGDVD